MTQSHRHWLVPKFFDSFIGDGFSVMIQSFPRREHFFIWLHQKVYNCVIGFCKCKEFPFNLQTNINFSANSPHTPAF